MCNPGEPISGVKQDLCGQPLIMASSALELCPGPDPWVVPPIIRPCGIGDY